MKLFLEPIRGLTSDSEEVEVLRHQNLTELTCE
jgi:hypothetical protein